VILFRLLILCVCLCINSFASANEAEPLPRVFGYVIGDVLVQRINLTNQEENIELAEIPELQRVGPWVQRLEATLTKDENSTTWLVMRYQVINSPFEPQEVALPALSLSTTSGKTIEIAAQPFSLMPLTLERGTENQLPFMLPNRVPNIANKQQVVKKIRYALVLLATTLLAWFIWWLVLRYRDRTKLPFTKAMQELVRLRNSSSIDINNNPKAWSAIHSALNTIAGQTLSATNAQEKLRKHGWLEPHQETIKTFFKVSEQRFFNPEAKPETFDLFKFCQSLNRAEKHHAAIVVSRPTTQS